MHLLSYLISEFLYTYVSMQWFYNVAWVCYACKEFKQYIKYDASNGLAAKPFHICTLLRSMMLQIEDPSSCYSSVLA